LDWGAATSGDTGDPMRLMFERDLTPSQYAAFYQWLQHGFQADAVVQGCTAQLNGCLDLKATPAILGQIFSRKFAQFIYICG